jgi:hypothetical protein
VWDAVFGGALALSGAHEASRRNAGKAPLLAIRLFSPSHP